jgi:hypothetical protein
LGWPCTFQYNKVLTTFPFDTRASFKVLGRNTCRDGTAWESFPLMSTPTSNTSTMALCGRRHYELNKTVSPIRRTANQQSTITIKQCHSQQTRLPPNTTTGNETQHTSQTAPPLATTLSPQGLVGATLLFPGWETVAKLSCWVPSSLHCGVGDAHSCLLLVLSDV